MNKNVTQAYYSEVNDEREESKMSLVFFRFLFNSYLLYLTSRTRDELRESCLKAWIYRSLSDQMSDD